MYTPERHLGLTAQLRAARHPLPGLPSPPSLQLEYAERVTGSSRTVE